MTPPRNRARFVLRGLLKFVALIGVAGGLGVALGLGLSSLSQDDQPTAPEGDESGPADIGTTTPGTGTSTGPSTTAAAPPAVETPATTTSAPAVPVAPVRLSVVDARLFTDAAPSGRQEQAGRLTVRMRAENSGAPVTLARPTLRVGSVRIRSERATTSGEFAALGAGESQTVTLRFALPPDATPKVVRDRRARILVAGQSVPMRVKVIRPRTP